MQRRGFRLRRWRVTMLVLGKENTEMTKFWVWCDDDGQMRFSLRRSSRQLPGATELSAPLPARQPCALLGRFGGRDGEEPVEIREFLFSDEAARGAETALRATDRDDWFVAVLAE
jgi:hypothetical protein